MAPGIWSPQDADETDLRVGFVVYLNQAGKRLNINQRTNLNIPTFFR